MVIVVNAEGQGPARTVGFVVDAVSDVYHLAAEHRKPAPDFGGAAKTEFVEGWSPSGAR